MKSGLFFRQCMICIIAASVLFGSVHANAETDRKLPTPDMRRLQDYIPQLLPELLQRMAGMVAEHQPQMAEEIGPPPDGIRLTGTIAGPPAIARAIIADETSGRTAVYQTGDIVSGATIQKIERNRVTLLYHNRKAYLQSASGPRSHAVASQVLNSRETGLPRGEAEALNALASFAMSYDINDLSGIDRDHVEALMSHLDDNSIALMTQALTEFFELPHGLLNDAEERTAFTLGLFDALRGNHGTAKSDITITSNALPDGTVTGVTGTMPASVGRVYAVFDNAGTLQGLPQVSAIWRDVKSNKVLLTHNAPICPDQGRNYVWFRPPGGWPGGTYRIDLYDPARNFAILGSKTFNVEAPK